MTVKDFDSHADPAVLKVSDEVALVVTGLQKGFKDWDFEGSSFGEVLKVHGHYASMHIAMNAFGEMARKALYESDDPAAAAKSLKKAAEEFTAYVVGLTSALPKQAFKMDVALAKAARPPMDGRKGRGSRRRRPKKPPFEEAEKAKKAIAGAPDPTGFEPGDGNGFAASPDESEEAKRRATEDDKKLTAERRAAGLLDPRWR